MKPTIYLALTHDWELRGDGSGDIEEIQFAPMGRLLAISENYPQLKANEQFNRLMDELSGTENRIAVERMRYNEKVQEYDTSRRQFPANVTAKMFGFKEYPFFQAPPEAKTAPKVTFTKPS